MVNSLENIDKSKVYASRIEGLDVEIQNQLPNASDNKSINTNTSDKLQTIGIIDNNNTTNAIKVWTGTRSQYDALKATPSWYAWVSNGTTYFTQSATPSVGDIVYDSNKIATSYTVSSVSGGNIAFNGGDTLYAWSYTSGDTVVSPSWAANTVYTKTTDISSIESAMPQYLYDSNGTADDIFSWIIGSYSETYIAYGSNTGFSLVANGPA